MPAYQRRWWSKRRNFKTSDVKLNKKGIYELVTKEEDVVEEIVTRLWLSGVPIYRERERVPVCPHCKAFVASPSESGHPDLHGVVPAKLARGRFAIPVYIEVKRPGGRHRPEQEKFIAQQKVIGSIAGFAESWMDVVRLFAENDIPLRAAYG
jgi:hypothetical protein